MLFPDAIPQERTRCKIHINKINMNTRITMGVKTDGHRISTIWKSFLDEISERNPGT